MVHVMCHMSDFFLDIAVKLIVEGSVINGPTDLSFLSARLVQKLLQSEGLPKEWIKYGKVCYQHSCFCILFVYPFKLVLLYE